MKVLKALFLQLSLSLIVSSNATAAENKSALYTAAEAGDLEKVKVSIGKGASPNAKDPQAGMTAMHIAAEKGHTDVLKYLLDHGGDINSQQHQYLDTPLIQAAQFGRIDAVKLLLSRGAKVNPKDKYGYTALTALANNVGVASNNSSRAQVEEIMKLLNKGGADANVSNTFGWDMLFMPAYQNDIATVKFLLSNNKIDPHKKNKEGETALDYCCRGQGGVEMFDMLTKAGFTSGKGLPFCLDGAAQQGKPELVKKLLTLTKPNPGQLAVAAMNQNANSEQVTLLILEKSPDINARRSETEMTPLLAAAATNKPKLAAALLKKGARLTDSGNFFTEGNPLHMAARFGHAEIVQMLLQAGADPNVKNKYGYTPLLLAVQGPIDYRPSDGPAPDYSKTPDYAKVVTLLVAKGADVKAADNSGQNVDKLLNAVRNDDFKTQIKRALSSR